MELIILGSGTAIPHRTRGASGYVVKAPDGTPCLLECGPGSTRRWPDAGVKLERARIIVVTHHHVDHCCDLPAVLFGRNVLSPPARTPLWLVGPAGHRAHIHAIEKMFDPWVVDEAGLRCVQEMEDGDQLRIPPFTIDARVMRHSRGAIGVRVECRGRTLAFSGDSGPCDALIELCRGADLALVECSYPSKRESERHLNPTTAGEIACEAGIERLVLTHFYPECDDIDIEADVRRAGYHGWLALAEDGARFEV
jgi:ribonuclease BN (tRNA processing enzyme)